MKSLSIVRGRVGGGKGIQIEGFPSWRRRRRTADGADDGKRAERSAHVSKPSIINIILGPTIVPHEGIETHLLPKLPFGDMSKISFHERPPMYKAQISTNIRLGR
jgi:hypothetical protein